MKKQRRLKCPAVLRRSFPQIGRFQGRDDEFRDPGLAGEPGAGHVKNLDAIRPDEGGDAPAFRFRDADAGGAFRV